MNTKKKALKIKTKNLSLEAVRDVLMSINHSKNHFLGYFYGIFFSNFIKKNLVLSKSQHI
jgi:hypothetical protein